MNKREIFDESQDFSLVLGGPLFQLYRRAYLSGDALELVWRRIVVIALVAWLPLFVLSLISGTGLGGGIKGPFLYDIEAHVRFLIALPILIAAELVVHSRLQPITRRFVERRIVAGEDIPKFHAAIKSAMRVRNSLSVEVILLILVYSLGLYLWRNEIATGVPSWYSMNDGSKWHLTLAGYWYAFVSIPIFQFILLRWYLRLFIWFQFLWRVSKLNLRLNALHPDRAAGIGFLGGSTYAFAPLLFAQGAMLSGLIASRVLYDGQDLLSFKMEAAGLVVFVMVFILSPLLVFTPHLSRERRRASGAYGGLASRYVQDFETKWIQRDESSAEQLLGNADLQSLADLGNSYAVIGETRLAPFGLKDVARLAAATAVPLLPLALTIFSLEELVRRLIKIFL